MKYNNDIGEIGESNFKLWCSNAGLIANKSTQDKKGWDYIVQFSIITPCKIVTDKSNDEISTIFQVKTTNNINNSVSISLKNWNNMIRIPIPAFIIYIVLNTNDNVKNVYMTHIDENYMSKILKRMRETPQNKLHKAKMVYKWDSKDEIFKDFGISIKNRILELVKNDFSNYCRNKAANLDSIGYNEITARGNLTIESTLPDIIDFSIGLKKSMPVKELYIESGLRFNIPARVETIQNAMIEISPIGKDITIELDNKKGLIANLKGKIYSPLTILKNISKENMKVRIESDIFEMLLYGDGKITGKFNISLSNKVMMFNEILNLSKAILIISDIENGFIIRLKREGEFSTELYATKEKMANLHIGEDILILARLIIIEANILNKYLANNDFEININDVMMQRQQIFEYNNIIEYAKNNTISIKFTTDINIQPGQRIIIPRIINININKKHYLLCVYYSGIPSQIDEKNNIISYIGIFNTVITKCVVRDNIDLEYERQELDKECRKCSTAIFYLENPT